LLDVNTNFNDNNYHFYNIDKDNKMILKKPALTAIAALLLGLTGCQAPTTHNSVTETTQAATVTTTAMETTIPQLPKRIIVMDFGALDTINALGLGNRIKGAPTSSIPQYLAKYHNSKVMDTGQMKQPDLDKIKVAKPDLIIIGARQTGFYQDLNAIAPTFNYSIKDNKHYVKEVKEKIAFLGKIADKEKVVDEKLHALDEKIANAQNIADHSDKTAIIAMHNDGHVMLINQGAYASLIFDELHVKRAVPVNAFSSMKLAPSEEGRPALPAYVAVTNEYIKSKKPSITYVIDRSTAIGKEAINNDYFDKQALSEAGTKVVYLTADLWYLSGAGLESLNQQIDEVITPLK
jgi:iron complex transport system substrate-binding protein